MVTKLREFRIITKILFFTLLLFPILLNANDTIKLNKLKKFGEAWSLIAFYYQFDNNTAKDYFELLTKELEILDNYSEIDSVFNKSLEKIISFADKRACVVMDSNIAKHNYKLICNNLFDWIDNEYIDLEKQSYFRKIADYGIIQSNTEYTLIPRVLSTIESLKNNESVSFLKNIEINNKYDVLGLYTYVFNVYNYFSNYPIDDCNNDSIYYSFADKILKIDNPNLMQTYAWLMMQIMSSQKDSHLTTNFNRWPTPLNKYVKLELNDTNVVIIDVAEKFAINNNLKVGDKIFTVDEVPVKMKIDYYRTLLEGSNTTVTNARISAKILSFNTNDTVVCFSTLRDGVICYHNINLNTIESQTLITDYFPDKFVVLNDSTSYINFGKCNTNEFAKYLKASKKMTTIIIDNREYPSDINFSNK